MHAVCAAHSIKHFIVLLLVVGAIPGGAAEGRFALAEVSSSSSSVLRVMHAVKEVPSGRTLQ